MLTYSFESYLPSVSLGNIIALSGQSSVQYRAAIKFISTFLRSSFQHIITQNAVNFSTIAISGRLFAAFYFASPFEEPL